MDNASKLLELARQKFGALTPSEEKVFRAVANGEVADYSAESEEDNDPAKANTWGSERLLKADRVAWLCTDPQASGLVTHRGIWVKGARLEGQLDLEEAQISFRLVFQKSALSEGINLRGGKLRGLYLLGTHSGSIWADRLKVEGGVFLRDGFKADGEVRLVGASIGGDLECDKGQFVNAGAYALCADGLKVDGDVFLRDGFKAEGEVRLLGATIRGSLECHKGQFVNADGRALAGDRLKVEGSVFLRDGFKAEGEVYLVSASVDNYFVWTNVNSPEKTTLDLRSAKIGTLYDEKDSWPEPGRLLLHGLVYDEIDDQTPTDAKSRIEWLQRQYGKKAEEDKEQFRPQPYEQLAIVLRKSGRDTDAKKILIAKNKDKARLTRLTRSERLWYRGFGPIIGYGYRPWRLVDRARARFARLAFLLGRLSCTGYDAGKGQRRNFRQVLRIRVFARRVCPAG